MSTATLVSRPPLASRSIASGPTPPTKTGDCSILGLGRIPRPRRISDEKTGNQRFGPDPVDVSAALGNEMIARLRPTRAGDLDRYGSCRGLLRAQHHAAFWLGADRRDPRRGDRGRGDGAGRLENISRDQGPRQPASRRKNRSLRLEGTDGKPRRFRVNRVRRRAGAGGSRSSPVTRPAVRGETRRRPRPVRNNEMRRSRRRSSAPCRHRSSEHQAPNGKRSGSPPDAVSSRRSAVRLATGRRWAPSRVCTVTSSCTKWAPAWVIQGLIAAAPPNGPEEARLPRGGISRLPAPVNGEANRQEWRTPPLWGIRDSGPYLHDGRATTLEQAIAIHGGEGKRRRSRSPHWIPERSLCS